MTLRRLLTLIYFYQRKSFLEHQTMTMIVSGYTIARKRSAENPKPSESGPNYLCENPRLSSMKESVTELRNFMVIWDVIVVL